MTTQPIALDRDDPALRREHMTPEGVPLRLPLASAGDRAGAFVIDGLIVLGAMLVLFVLLAIFGTIGSEVSSAILLLAIFVLRNFYFAGLETLWRGRTIGKRIFGLRVVDARGEGLRTEAILARNLLREIETFLPLVMLLAPESLWPGASPLIRLVAGLWGVGLLLLPLFNRDCRRAGDFVAGTIVISERRARLGHDLSEATSTEASQAGPAFTPEQLSHYGIYELQVLEEVLRGGGVDQRSTLHAIADRVATKISWPDRRTIGDPRAFLEAFYAAQRAHLEREMLFGERVENKHARAKGGARRSGRGG